MRCRHCAHPLTQVCLDLGSAPPSNAYLSADAMRAPEAWYPLRLFICDRCWLLQTEDGAGRDALFTDKYAYFSSYSSSWLAHAQRYVNDIVARFGLGPSSRVCEVAANDGYLLRYVTSAGIPCYGIEPTTSTAEAARELGLEIVERFFGVALAEELCGRDLACDLIAANNVLAHVPDINDFVAGFAVLLKPDGVATFEFPHLWQMMRENQFDTVYHEHYSYLSLTVVQRIFDASGLAVFDVEELSTHGGSLRVFAQRSATGTGVPTPRVAELLQREEASGVSTLGYYADFQARADRVKNDFHAFLVDLKRGGHSVAAYGAAAKGNTLMNYAGIRPDLLSFVVDRNPAKQGKFMPGSRIPIVDEAVLREAKPSHIVILPWNLRSEVMAQLAYAREWGARFVTAVPTLQCEA